MLFLIILGDELFSDSFPMQLVDGIVYKVKGKASDVASFLSDYAYTCTFVPKRVKFLYAAITYRAKVLGEK